MTFVALATAAPRELRELALCGTGADRAYADALLRMAWARSDGADERGELLGVLAELRSASRQSHAELRSRIASGVLRGPSLRELFDAVPPLERDHFVEEALGIAYPPLDEGAPGTDLMSYAPSGYDEIVCAFEQSKLAAGDRFLDLGAGLGKVVMLAELLTGAASVGVEYDKRLCDVGNEACRELGLQGERLRAQDARELASFDADVVFMYLPFSGQVLTTVMARLLDDARPRYLCTGALELQRYPELSLVGPPQSWLNVYARGG
ncbi:MAG TPA: class I SAM-dependent methyltransferase [Polyangiaceae bacterium]|nr:class I SAM-dependent methyltransferase [Polyangiaceae bacterium]